MTVHHLNTAASSYNEIPDGFDRDSRTFGAFGTDSQHTKIRYAGEALNSRNHGYAFGIVGPASIYNTDDGQAKQGPHAYLFATANVISSPPQPRTTEVVVRDGDVIVDLAGLYILQVHAPRNRWSEPTLEVVCAPVTNVDRSDEVAKLNAERATRGPLSETYLSM